MSYTLNQWESGNRWTDTAFLEKLANASDDLADEYLDIMVDEFGAKQSASTEPPDPSKSLEALQNLFRLDVTDTTAISSAFPGLVPFFQETGKFPPGTDIERCARGAKVFEKTEAVSCLILLTKGLPEGYASASLTEVLDLSELLLRHPFKRLLATLEMLLQVNRSFHPQRLTDEKDARGIAALGLAQKLRLWHAGIRDFALIAVPGFEAKHGMPISIFDMSATIMGFSLLVIEGWEKLYLEGVSDQDKEDYFYMWRVYSLMFGIHPKGEPGNTCYIPNDVADAREFYKAYAAKCYAPNKKGIALAGANLQMLEEMVPKILRLFGLRRMPRAYMSILMGEKFCKEMLQLPRLYWDIILVFVLLLLGLLARVFRTLHLGDRFAGKLFDGLINKAFGSGPVLVVGDNMSTVIKEFEKESKERQRKKKEDEARKLADATKSEVKTISTPVQ